MLTLGSYYKKAQEGWLTTDAFLYWAQQDFSGVKPLVAQVKGHLFPYSRYFTLSTESISDEQSRDGKAIFFSTVNSRAPKSIGVRCNSTNHKDRDA